MSTYNNKSEQMMYKILICMLYTYYPIVYTLYYNVRRYYDGIKIINCPFYVLIIDDEYLMKIRLGKD